MRETMDVASKTDSLAPHLRVSLAETIARDLEGEITGGTLRPGDRLGTKSDLRRRFGVAAATINEAVRLLEMRGLLVARPGPGGGIFVTSAPARVRLNQFVLGYRWGEATVADYHVLRNALEPLVCREAAAYRRPADVAELREMLEAMRGNVEEPLRYLRDALHRRVARMCRNAPLHSFYLTVIDFLEDALEGAEFGRFDALEHLERHVELVDAIAEGPGERLETAIERHERGIFPR
jgi:GntR family transcriptional regulator, transcriptional repressor for pyruvate dehydrogenase complex